MTRCRAHRGSQVKRGSWIPVTDGAVARKSITSAISIHVMVPADIEEQ